MAQIRPQIIPEAIQKEPLRSAEIMVYNALKNTPKNWFVLYGVNYFLKKNKTSWIEGEADFVVLSPQIGLVVIEVKGGQVGRDEDGWFSMDRYGEKHLIKDPSLQAASCKHHIVKFLKENISIGDKFIPAKHMVCFPNVSVKDSRTLIELPREMQIFAEDLNSIEKHIVAFTQRHYDENLSPLTDMECENFANILKPNFKYPTRWSLQVERQNLIMNSLTDEQSYIWDLVGKNQKIALSGPAGSGKTILGIKLAKKFIENNEKVLIIVPSYSLRQYYENSLDHKVTIVCYQNNFFEESAIDYDLIIVDEGQDIDDDLWISLYASYHIDRIKNLLVIFDSNQKFKNCNSISPFENLVQLHLTKVIRNTKPIGEFTAQFYVGNIKENIIGPDGVQVQYTVCEDGQYFDTVTELIHNYVVKEGFQFSDITVLFGQSGRRQFIIDRSTKKIKKNKYGISYKLLSAATGVIYKNPYIIADSVFHFRGLESNIIILCDIDQDDIQTLQSKCYVGASRARNILHIVATSHTIDQIFNNTK